MGRDNVKKYCSWYWTLAFDKTTSAHLKGKRPNFSKPIRLNDYGLTFKMREAIIGITRLHIAIITTT
jgi:hypothetical protein